MLFAAVHESALWHFSDVAARADDDWVKTDIAGAIVEI